MKKVKILAKNENCQNPYEKMKIVEIVIKKMTMVKVFTKKNENAQHSY